MALLLGGLAITVLVVVVDPGTFGSTDWVRMHSLYKAYCRSSLADGRLPLWNPYQWLGRPFLADIESAFFYPPEWLYLWLDLHLACALTCALHYLLLLYGMVKLTRALGAERWPSLFVAFVLAASAPIVGCFTSGLVHYGQALCFLPLVLYLGVRVQAGPGRRDVAGLALVLGLQVLCGHPQAAWLTEVALVVFLLGRRLQRPWRWALAGLAIDLAALALALGLGMALAGVALLPLGELAAQGNRPGASVAFASLWAEPSFGWATLAVPTQSPRFAFQANAQLYAGLLPLVAGLCGLCFVRERNMRALGLLAGFAGLLAAGDATPVFGVFFHLVPGVGWLRIHSRATVLVSFALLTAAGLFLSRQADRRSRRRMALGSAAVATVVGLVGVSFCLRWPGFGPAAGSAAALRAGLAALAGLALVLWAFAHDRDDDHAHAHAHARRPRRLLAGAIAMLTLVDLGLALRDLKRDNRATDATDFVQRLHALLAQQDLLGPGKAPPRVFLPGPVENAGMREGWSSVQGYSALAPGRVWRHIHQVLGVDPPFGENTFPSTHLAAFGPFPYPSMAMVIGVDPSTRQVVLNRHPDPRAYLATSVRRVRDDVEATALMRAGHAFHETALVEQDVDLSLGRAPGSVPEGTERPGRVTIDRFEPERISLGVDSVAPALLVLAEPWYPGWSARVNGKAAPCLPANAWMRAVPVPAGQSQVELVFHSTHLVEGALLSLLALATIVLLLAWPRSRSQR